MLSLVPAANYPCSTQTQRMPNQQASLQCPTDGYLYSAQPQSIPAMPNHQAFLQRPCNAQPQNILAMFGMLPCPSLKHSKCIGRIHMFPIFSSVFLSADLSPGHLRPKRPAARALLCCQSIPQRPLPSLWAQSSASNLLHRHCQQRGGEPAGHAGRRDGRGRAGVAAPRHSIARPPQRPEPGGGAAGHPHPVPGMCAQGSGVAYRSYIDHQVQPASVHEVHVWRCGVRSGTTCPCGPTPSRATRTQPSVPPSRCSPVRGHAIA